MKEIMDTSDIGKLAMDFMEELSETCSDGCTVEIVGMVAEVRDEDGDSVLFCTATDDRPWVQMAFFDAAAEAIESSTEEEVEEP